MMKRHMRLISIMLILFTLMCAFVSSACIAREVAHPHVCTGVDCPLCRLIALIGQVNRALAAALIWLLAIIVLVTPDRSFAVWGISNRLASCTLVGRKIRLND